MATTWYDPLHPRYNSSDGNYSQDEIRSGAMAYAAEQDRLAALRNQPQRQQPQRTPQDIEAMSAAQQRLDEQRSRDYRNLPKPGSGSGAMPARVNQTGDQYAQGFGYDDNGNFVNFDWFTPEEAAGGSEGYNKGRDAYDAAKAQRAFMAMQGIQNKQDAAAMKATERLLNNPGMQFGKGGGDWASAWSKAMQPQRGIFESLVGNQLGSFLDYGKGLNQTFNSATGPYGQMQAAAVATAPSRAQRAISKDKLGMLSGLFDQMSANKTPSVSSVETDYGAYAKMLPSLMKKYLPGG